MSSDEGDLYEELLADSFRLCRRIRTASYWVGWIAVAIAVASVVVFVFALWPESIDAGETYLGSGAPGYLPSWRQRIEGALRTLPYSLGQAGLVGALAVGLRLMARRLELDLVTEYSDDDE